MKKFMFVMSMVLAVCPAVGLVSCSSDDEEDTGPVTPSEVPSPVLTDSQGHRLRVTSFGGSVQFRYDESGKLTSFGEYGKMYDFKEDVFTLETEDGTYNIAMNGQGLISRISMTLDEVDEDGSYNKGDGVINYQYNGDRQLVSVSGFTNYDTYDKSENSHYIDKTSGAYRLTWNNGNLEKYVMECSGTETEDGETFNYKESGTSTYTYGNQPNVFRQLPYYMANGFLGDGIDVFCVLGLYGVGPAYLPTQCTEVETGDRYDTETHNYTYNFILNDNGSINTEKRDYNSYAYIYSNAVTRAGVIQSANDTKAALLKLSDIRKMFRHKSVRK